MKIIERGKLFLGAAIVLVGLSWFFILTNQPQQGIDLKGGAEWTIKTSSLSEAEIRNIIQKHSSDITPTVVTQPNNHFLIRLPHTEERERRVYTQALNEKAAEPIQEVSFTSVGPTIGKELRSQAVKGGIATIVGISLYVMWAFRKASVKIASWKYGAVTLLTLFHDISIPIGVYALVGRWWHTEINTAIIIALLITMGYSVNDTIIVFDRIREHLRLHEKNKPLKEIMNTSLTETMGRSVSTSFTVVIALVSLLVLGPSTLFYFVLTMLIGTIAGTYSSIFVASPLLYMWTQKNYEKTG